jgi:hypothetical protein
VKGKGDRATLGEMRRKLHLWFPHLTDQVDEYMDETEHQGLDYPELGENDAALRADFQAYMTVYEEDM